MKIAYIRVSRDSQLTALQEDAMQKEQVDKTYIDHASGKNTARPEFQRMLSEAQPGDCIICWRLDRMGRSLIDLVNVVNDLKARGIGFRSLMDGIDTCSQSATSQLIFNIMASLAQFERDLIRERTYAGLDAARVRGHRGGKPRVTDTIPQENLERARLLYAEGKTSVKDIMQVCGFKSKNAFYAFIKSK